MEIAEVEVHPRPRRNDDDDGCLSGDDSPAIAIGVGQRTATGGEINPLAPRVLRTPPSTEVEGGAHVNPVALDNENRIVMARSPPRRNQSEIEIEPEMNDEPTSSRDSAASRRMCGSADSTASDSDTADDAPLLTGSSQAVRIDMPSSEKPASPHDRFPKERSKALISFVLLAFAGVMNEIVLSFVHERVPETPPLPDITFSLIPYYKDGLKICEYIMLASFASVLLLMLFHRHRWIMFRRLMMVGSLLYLMRCVTMIVTQVPVADPNFLCAPKYGENATFWNVVLRGLKMVSGVGLNVRGKYTLCGDYIYSGHTIVLVISALFIGEYSPRRWRIVHIFFWLVAFVGVVFLVISRGHYTLDVILSYFICTRIFWNYHTMVAHPTIRLSTQNHHRKEFWFPLFRWMECNVLKPIPRRFDCPLPMGRMRSMFRRRVANARIE